MKNRMLLSGVLSLIIFSQSCVRTSQEKAKWHHPLYMANNDYWRQRIPVTIRNNMGRELLGDPIELKIGKSKGQAPLAGVLAEGIRVATSDGGELTYRVTDIEGNLVERGPVPENGTIAFPVECKSDTVTTNYIYFDNPSAWAVGDFYKTHREVLNDGLEKETKYGPLGWELSLPENNNRVECIIGEAHEGERSIKIRLGSTPVTIPFGAIQKNIHLMSGMKYVLEAWIKGENIDGDAQVAVILGNQDSEDFKLGIQKVSGGNGTFDWKKVTLEFTPTEKVTGAHIQTLLEGTGTVWFDDIKITCSQDYNITAGVLKTEKLSMKMEGKTDEWFDDDPNDQNKWQSRSAIKTINIQDEDVAEKLICVDIEGVVNRLYSEVNENTSVQVTNGIKPVPFYRAGDYVMFKQDLGASSEQTNYIYFSSDEGETGDLKVDNINDLDQNLIKNSDFESKDLSIWKGDTGKGNIEISTNSKTGTGSVGLKVEGEAASEEMIEQTIPVKANMTYFFSAWMKCTDMIKQPDFFAGIRQRTLRAQFIAIDGTPVGKISRLALNPERHIDNAWSQLYMLIKAPKEANSVKLQLVNGAPGTVWFDDVIFTEIITGVTSPLAIERKAARDLKELMVWQEDPVVKVFQDDLPPATPSEFVISSARNEVEPLQLVVRSPQEYKQVQIKVNPPIDINGNKLEQIETGIVGYVPINYPSSYFNDRITPYWRQKVPTGRPGSDGWVGMWPDPILPFQSFDLKANVSQPLWIEFSIPKNTKPGDYTGQVQLIFGTEVIKEIPYKVHVWDFELPDESHMVALYDARINNRINNMIYFDYAKSEQEIKKEIWEMLANHRLTPDVITPSPVWKLENGKIVFDFTEFDKAADYYFNILKFSSVYSPSYFRLFGWANLPQEKFGEKPYPGEFPYPGADRSKLRPEFKKAYQSALRSYWNHMKEKGWADKVVFYISDEPHNVPEITRQMRALCDMIHEVDPNIPIYVSTWWYRPEYEGYVDVWGVSNHGGGWGRPVPESDLIKIRHTGGRLYFTTDGKMCTDTPYLGFERMLPYFCFKYEAETYEFWGSNWYTFNPYEYGWHSYIRQSDRPGDLYWIRYPNGDANFIYPGKPIGLDSLVPTIRLKVAREGVEDYEYLYYLDSLIKLAKKKGKDTGQAEGALKAATDLVTIPSSEGRYSTEYLPDPYIVLRVRIKVAEAIEGLLK